MRKLSDCRTKSSAQRGEERSRGGEREERQAENLAFSLSLDAGAADWRERAERPQLGEKETEV